LGHNDGKVPAKNKNEIDGPRRIDKVRVYLMQIDKYQESSFDLPIMPTMDEKVGQSIKGYSVVPM